jgi:hypothetical protein
MQKPNWTDDLKREFIRVFFRTADSRVSDSGRSGFDDRYLKWCESQGIEPYNASGGYSFYQELHDVITDASNPDDSWNVWVLTEKGRALLECG